MADEVFEKLCAHFKRIAENDLTKGALNFADATFQFRVVEEWPKDPHYPYTWHLERDGEWYWVEIKNGTLKFGSGYVSDKLPFRECIPVQAERKILLDILEGRIRPSDAWFSDKLFVGNFSVGSVNGAWVIALLRLGQAAQSGYWNYLPSQRQKMFMKVRY
ncbi:MAG: hypothetical protein ACE5JS_02585 [Nitrospinota bacterium]